MKVAEIIREHRHNKGWSQEKLAERAGLHTNTVRSIELGINHPRPKTLAKLNSVLGINDYNYS